MPTCFFCGADTPTQQRRPGLLSKLKPEHRGRFGYCPDHESDAIAKLNAAIGIDPSHAEGRIPDGSRPGIAGEQSEGGKDRTRGKGGDNGASSQGDLFG